MASQINPVISAFLQARQQADERGRAMLQQQLMQQRLEQEAQADEALNEYRLGQLQLNATKANQEFKLGQDAHKLRQLQTQLTGLGNVTTGIKENIYGPEAVQEILNMIGASSAIASGVKNYEQRQAEIRQAEIAKIKETAGVEADAAGQKAGAIAQAQQNVNAPFKREILENQQEHDKEMQAILAKDRNNLEAIRQNRADARAAARNAINKQLGISSSVVTRLATTHDSHPIARDMATRLASYNAIKTLDLNTKNPGDDISAITQFAKIIDPSVVRPSEYETVRHYFQSLPDNIQAQIKRTVNSGGTVFLTPQARQGIKDASANLMRGQVSVYLPYRSSIIGRINDLTQSDLGEDYLGTGFFPEEVVKAGDKYIWADKKNKIAIPLYGGKK